VSDMVDTGALEERQAAYEWQFGDKYDIYHTLAGRGILVSYWPFMEECRRFMQIVNSRWRYNKQI
jgi:hypothetical protein